MDKVVLNNPALFRAAMKKEHENSMIPLGFCKYNKVRKSLTLSSSYLGMPSTVYIRSHHTGKIVRFTPVTPSDSLFDQDGWDGEMQIYRPVGNVPGVDHLVIHNQY
jgi:hypothetical protein